MLWTVSRFKLLWTQRYEEKTPGTTELVGGTAYTTGAFMNEDQMRVEQAQVNSMAQQSYAMATGNVYAHANFDQRLAFYQNLHRSNLPCTPVVSRTYKGTEAPTRSDYQQ